MIVRRLESPQMGDLAMAKSPLTTKRETYAAGFIEEGQNNGPSRERRVVAVKT